MNTQLARVSGLAFMFGVWVKIAETSNTVLLPHLLEGVSRKIKQQSAFGLWPGRGLRDHGGWGGALVCRQQGTNPRFL